MDAELKVTLNPTEGEFVESPQASRYPWAFRVTTLEIHYRWSGMWRVVSSVAYGTAIHGSPPPSFSWTFGQHNKPLWVAALEHDWYPRELWHGKNRRTSGS